MFEHISKTNSNHSASTHYVHEYITLTQYSKTLAAVMWTEISFGKAVLFFVFVFRPEKAVRHGPLWLNIVLWFLMCSCSPALTDSAFMPRAWTLTQRNEHLASIMCSGFTTEENIIEALKIWLRVFWCWCPVVFIIWLQSKSLWKRASAVNRRRLRHERIHSYW